MINVIEFRTQCQVSSNIARPVASACNQNLSVENENEILSKKVNL